MTNPNIEYDQRVIYTALKRMTSEHSLLQNAFQFWQQNYAHKPLNVIEYCTKLVDYLGLTDSQKKMLMVAMHAASNRLPEDLPEVPAVLLNGAAVQADDQMDTPAPVAQAKPKELQRPYLIVATAFLQQIVQQLRKYHRDDADELVSILRTEGINDDDSVAQTLVSHWAGNGLANLNLPNEVTEEQCKILAHELYLLVCELIGPVAADTLIHRVNIEVGKLEAAVEFDPLQLT